MECPQTLKAPEVGQSSSSLQNPEAAGSRDNSRDDLAANDTVGSGRSHLAIVFEEFSWLLYRLMGCLSDYNVLLVLLLSFQFFL